MSYNDSMPWSQDDVDAEMGLFGGIGKILTAPIAITRAIGSTVGGAIGGKAGAKIGGTIGGLAGGGFSPSHLLTAKLLNDPKGTARLIGNIGGKAVVSLSGRTGMTADGRLTDGQSSSNRMPCACGTTNTNVSAAEAGIDSQLPRLVKEKLAPELKVMHNMLARAQIQREVTSEHNSMMGRADFQRKVLTDLDALAACRNNKPAQSVLARFRAAFGL